MALPFPHGDAAGQIAHNAFYGDSDTPGSIGGRFVGFGEEGTSLIANRPHWALSENIQYLYEKLSKEFAMPQMDYWVPAGGSGSYYDFSGTKVFCGDASYLPWTQLKMDALFSILDEHYNQLIDPITQGKVVGKSIRVDPDDVYGTGFVTSPRLRFWVVDPDNPDAPPLVPSYTIPDGTKVYILHGRQTTLELLPVDAFTKVPIRVGEEIPAGVVLQNGTRPMTGDLNMDTWDINNVSSVNSPTASDLSIMGDSGAENLWLTQWTGIHLSCTNTLHLHGDVLTELRGADINLQDSRLGAPVYLTKSGTTAMQGMYSDNLLGTLNSRWYNDSSMHGNRVRSISGSFTFTNGTRQITWPALDVILNGDRVSVAGGTTTIPDATDIILVVQSNGTVVQRAPAAVLDTDLPIAYGYHSAGSFLSKLDARWMLSRRTGMLDIVVGGDDSGNPYTGCDFGDLQKAIDFIMCAQKINYSLGKTPLSSTILIHGSVTVNTSVKLYTTMGATADSIRIIGDGNAAIKALHPGTQSTFDCNLRKITVEGIHFYWGAATVQNDGQGCFLNPGSNSCFDRLKFDRHGGSNQSWANAFYWNAGVADHVDIGHCTAQVNLRFCYSNGTAGWCHIHHCWAGNFSGTVSANYAYDMTYDSNIIEYCEVYYSGSLFDGGIRIGPNGRVVGCKATTSGAGKGIVFEPVSPVYNQCQVTIQNNIVDTAWAGIGCDIPVGFTGITCHVHIVGNLIMNCVSGIWCDNDPGDVDPASTIHIDGNTIRGITGGFLSMCNGIFVKYMPHANIEGNTITNNAGMGIWIADDVLGSIRHNRVMSYSDTGAFIGNFGFGDGFTTLGKGIVRLTDAGYTFNGLLNVGDYIAISGATTGGNNGCFLVVSVPGLSGNSIDFYNPSGWTEAYTGMWWFAGTKASAIWVQRVASDGAEVIGNFCQATYTVAAALWAPIIDMEGLESRIEGNCLDGYSSTASAYARSGIHLAWPSGNTVIGNFITDIYRWSVVLTNGLALLGINYLNNVTIAGNHLEGGVHTLGSAIRSWSAGGLDITGNVIEGGSGGVDLCDIADIGTAENIVISGNVFNGVYSGGIDNGHPSVINLGGNDTHEAVSITGNSFFNCGYHSSSTWIATICNWRRNVSITGNLFSNPSSWSGTTTGYVIYTYWGGTTIVGNAFKMDVGGGFIPGTGYAVFIDDQFCVVSENVFQITGDQGIRSFYGICFGGYAVWCACESNVFSEYTGGGSRYSIFSASTHSTFIGNTSANANIDIQGTHNMVIGNICAYFVNVGGANFTSGNHGDGIP